MTSISVEKMLKFDQLSLDQFSFRHLFNIEQNDHHITTFILNLDNITAPL